MLIPFQVPMLIVGRLLNGLGAGQLTAVFPVYVSEIAPPTVRGMLGGFQMVCTVQSTCHGAYSLTAPVDD